MGTVFGPFFQELVDNFWLRSVFPPRRRTDDIHRHVVAQKLFLDRSASSWLKTGCPVLSRAPCKGPEGDTGPSKG